jgi:hypothetical protein
MKIWLRCGGMLMVLPMRPKFFMECRGVVKKSRILEFIDAKNDTYFFCFGDILGQVEYFFGRFFYNKVISL